MPQVRQEASSLEQPLSMTVQIGYLDSSYELAPIYRQTRFILIDKDPSVPAQEKPLKVVSTEVDKTPDPNQFQFNFEGQLGSVVVLAEFQPPEPALLAVELVGAAAG